MAVVPLTVSDARPITETGFLAFLTVRLAEENLFVLLINESTCVIEAVSKVLPTTESPGL